MALSFNQSLSKAKRAAETDEIGFIVVYSAVAAFVIPIIAVLQFHRHIRVNDLLTPLAEEDGY
jgi:hypothetical protein